MPHKHNVALLLLAGNAVQALQRNTYTHTHVLLPESDNSHQHLLLLLLSCCGGALSGGADCQAPSSPPYTTASLYDYKLTFELPQHLDLAHHVLPLLFAADRQHDSNAVSMRRSVWQQKQAYYGMCAVYICTGVCVCACCPLLPVTRQQGMCVVADGVSPSPPPPSLPTAPPLSLPARLCP